MSKTHDVNSNGRQFVNRLSDLLFVMARAFNKHAGQNDVLWEHDRSKSGWTRDQSGATAWLTRKSCALMGNAS